MFGNEKKAAGALVGFFEKGKVFEKAGVNISAVHGKLPQAMQTYFKTQNTTFYACGLSLVLHPENPMVPTVHANWRFFEMYDNQGKIKDQWFGGGQDLTPHYLFEEDAKHFHSVCKKICDDYDPNFYPQYKKKCDDYFWNTHRGEARGIGGIFFDYLRDNNQHSLKKILQFVKDLGNHFSESYFPIVKKRKKSSYTRLHKKWQKIRRGRYVEFNLLHDKGTLFGLKTNGKIESILMSLPPSVLWKYNFFPKKNSEEEKLVKVLQQPKDWVF